MKGQSKVLASGMERERGQAGEGRGPRSAQLREVSRMPQWFLTWSTGEMPAITKGCVCVRTHTQGDAGLGLEEAGNFSAGGIGAPGLFCQELSAGEREERGHIPFF